MQILRNIYQINCWTPRSQISIFFFTFVFKVNHVFLEGKDSPAEKVVIDEEELDDIEMNRI